MKVAAIGDNVVDIYLDQKRMYLGGNSLNFANFATEFPDVQSMYIGNFGNDELSTYVKRVLGDLSVDYSFSRELDGESGYSKVTLKNGDRVFITSNRGGVLKKGIQLSVQALSEVNQYDLVHFNINGNADQYLRDISGPKIVYDYSDFSSREQIRHTINQVDIACFSMGDASEETVQNLIKEVHQLSTNKKLIILITRGEYGAVVSTATGKIYRQDAVKVDRVVDTMGAGDAFITAFSISLEQSESIPQALKIASDYSAKQIQRNGSFEHGVVAPAKFLQ